MAATTSMTARRIMNKAIDHQSMRGKISFTKTFQRIEQLEDEIYALTKPEKSLDSEGNEVLIHARPDSATVAALKVLLDSNWRKVNKLLPDFKAASPEGVGIIPDLSKLTDNQLKALVNGESINNTWKVAVVGMKHDV